MKLSKGPPAAPTGILWSLSDVLGRRQGMTCSPLIMTELGKGCRQCVGVRARGGTQIQCGTTETPCARDASEIKGTLTVEVKVGKQNGGVEL